jgi:hypothetical protein
VEARKKGERKRTKEQSCQALADGPARRGGQSGLVPRTIRPNAVDSPARSRRQSVKANRTTRDEPGKTDCPQGPGGPSAPDPDRPLLKLGPSAKRLQQKPKTKPDQHKNSKTKRRTGLTFHIADGPRRRGGLSASSNRTEKSRAREVSSTNSSPEIPNGSSS